MSTPLRIGLLIAALAAAIIVLTMKPWRDTAHEKIGMTEQPCMPTGQSVTGRGIDDWPGLCLYRTANEKLLAGEERPDIVMIGDSLTAEWPDLTDNIVTRGIGGQTSTQILVRFGQDAVALEPKIVHILAGTNDTAGNTGPTSPDMFMTNITAMVDMAQANGIEVILGTIPPAETFPWRPDVDPQDWAQVLGGTIAALAKQRGLVLADYHAVLANSDGSIRDGMFHDGAHPTEAGYAAMRAVLDDAIERARARSEASAKAD